MLEEYVGKVLQPTDVVINSGLWGTYMDYVGLDK